MNEFTETPISTDAQALTSVNSVFDNNDDIVFYIENIEEIAPFPWMSFLKDDTELILSENISIRGISTYSLEHNIDILSIDPYGMQMIEDSAKLLYESESVTQIEWIKLPENLSWLYKDKPYMKASDVTQISNEIRSAINNGYASSDLISFINTHTYRAPLSILNYNSYGAYYDNSMVEFVRRSMVNMKLGIENKLDIQNIEFSKVDNELILTDSNANVAEITFQRRIGDYQSVYTTTIISDSIISNIFLGTGGTGLDETTENSSSKFIIVLDKFYSNTNQLPIWCEKNTFTSERTTPIWVLVSESGNIPAEPELVLRTSETVIVKNGTTFINSANRIFFDNDSAVIDMISEEEIYTEYHLT